MRRAPLLAVAVSALLGVVCGIVGGVILHQNAAGSADPLGVGVPLVNQPCTGDSVLVVGWGHSQSAIAAAVAQAPGGDARYLDTGASCRTAWQRPGHAPPRYIAYLGPASTAASCARRMAAAETGLLVTVLHRGNTEPVQCLCHVAAGSMPVLRPTPAPSVLERIYIRGLQDVLVHMRRIPADHRTSSYDRPTQAAVGRFQQEQGLPADGVVDTVTWSRLLTLGCRRYDN